LEVGFADVHCFPYSKREGTVGAKLKELPSSVKDQRMDVLLEVKKQLKAQFIAKNLGKTLSLVSEEIENGYTVGYTENYIRVYVKGELPLKEYEVRLIKEFEDGALAEIL
jgi:threonylcarbamoyladenosine tRNA methylthiotransferase MtaB